MSRALIFVSIVVFLLVAALFYVQMQNPPVIVQQVPGPEVYIQREPEVYVVGTDYWPSSYWNWWGGYHPGYSGPTPYWGERTRPWRSGGHRPRFVGGGGARSGHVGRRH